MAKIRLSGLVDELRGTANGMTISNGQYGAIVQTIQRTRRGMGRMKWPSHQDLITRYNDTVITKSPKTEPTLQQLLKYMPIALKVQKSMWAPYVRNMDADEIAENARAILKMCVNLKGGFFSSNMRNDYGFPVKSYTASGAMTYEFAVAIVERYLLLRAIYGITVAAGTFAVTSVAAAATIGYCYAELSNFTIPMYIQALRLDKLANGIRFIAGYPVIPKLALPKSDEIETVILPKTTHLMCWYKICTSATSNHSGRGWVGGKSLGAGLGPVIDLAHNAYFPREALFNGSRIWLTVGSCDELSGGISWWGTGFVGGKAQR